MSTQSFKIADDGKVFSATFAGVAVAAAQDAFEIVAPANGRVVIRDILLAQYSDAGDAAAELLAVSIHRGFTTSGSGGSTVTPARRNGNSGAAATVVEANNTTLAADGTAQVLLATSFNIAAGFHFAPPADERIALTGGQRLVVRVSAPADSLTMSGTIVFEEF